MFRLDKISRDISVINNLFFPSKLIFNDHFSNSNGRKKIGQKKNDNLEVILHDDDKEVYGIL